VTFAANDGSKVFADLYTSNADSRWLVVLFHQAGSNAAEYASIAPRIAALGLDALAVDLRSGGRLWEADNRTAATYESPQPYEASLPDMEAALDWAAAQGKYSWVVVWGSSYTASLALKLVARPEIAGMILSSPGEYFPNESVAEWAKAADRFPILITASPEEAEDDEKAIFEAMPTPPGPAPHRLVHHEGGIHGASTADPDRCEAADRYWSDVRGYFELIRPRRPRKGPHGQSRPKGQRVFGYANRNGVYGAWRTACKEAGIDAIMPHAAGRHGFGTEMLVRQHLDPATVASGGRWADMALMLRTYIHAEDPTSKIQEALRAGRDRLSKKDDSRTNPVQGIAKSSG
ncbi:MAG: alpha/beta hydrolase, partial [Nitrospirae bacterium]|nr:alpha/beta hydrolase [Fimbriimonadaceae bacterium]